MVDRPAGPAQLLNLARYVKTFLAAAAQWRSVGLPRRKLSPCVINRMLDVLADGTSVRQLVLPVKFLV